MRLPDEMRSVVPHMMSLALVAAACSAPASSDATASTLLGDPPTPFVSPSVEPSATSSPSGGAETSASPSQAAASPSVLASAPLVKPSSDDFLALAGRGGVPGLLHCGTEFAFTFDALDNPTGAEDLVGAEYDALREVLRTGEHTVLPGLGPDPTAREVARYDQRVAFLIDGDPDPGNDNGETYLYVYFNRVGDSWAWAGSGGCEPQAVLPPGYFPATFVIDPAHSQPTAETRAIHILVTESRCSGGRSATGRIGPAYVLTDAHEIHVQIVVKALPGGHDCPGNPPTPARLRLPEPLGDRRIRDVNARINQGTGG